MQHNASRQGASRGRGQVSDQAFGKGTEDVVVGNLPALLRLNPLRSQAMQPAPRLEVWAQADHVEERTLPHHAADCGAVVMIEIAVNGDAARLGEGDRLFDLPALEVTLFQLTPRVRTNRPVRAHRTGALGVVGSQG